MIRDGKRYDVKYDNEGDPLLVSPATGEVEHQGIMYPLFPGDRVTTPAQQEASKKYVDSLKRAAGRRSAVKEFGQYFFTLGNQRFDGLKPQTATRLIYLQTFADYTMGNRNRLKLNSKTDMRRSDLSKVLGLSYDAAADFFYEVNPTYIVEDRDGLLFTTTDVFIRGALNLGETYYRTYCNGVAKLYNETSKTKHRYLGYIFQLLPFVNIEFNVLCRNPMETELKKVEFLTLDEFCKLIDFDKSNVHRLLKTYDKLRFTAKDNDGTHLERFVSVVFGGGNIGTAKIFVNPRILYSGSNHEKVQILGAFCE